MTDRLTEIGRCCGAEMSVEKCKVMRIPRESYQIILLEIRNYWRM
jgi:hypothetical protein